MARIAIPRDEFQPIAAINTTPLVDVMLVLLIMFILVVPVATHKVPVDLPAGASPPRELAPVHRLDIDAAGTLRWDGAAVPRHALPELLAGLRADPRGPELHMSADAEARYETFDETLAQVRRAGIARLGFVGNERFATAIDPAR